MDLTPITLHGNFVRLEPLTLEHLDAACAAGLKDGVFRWFPEPVLCRDEMKQFIEKGLLAHQESTALPFATIRRSDNVLVGSTRFANISHRDDRVEIGWTWLSPDAQRTAINTEAKFLMFKHAFEVWKCARVELKTDSRNERSRAAIARVGAKQEGILRCHIRTDYIGLRDTVFFSVIQSEWPEVKETLLKRLRTE